MAVAGTLSRTHPFSTSGRLPAGMTSNSVSSSEEPISSDSNSSVMGPVAGLAIGR